MKSKCQILPGTSSDKKSNGQRVDETIELTRLSQGERDQLQDEQDRLYKEFCKPKKPNGKP